MDHQIQRAHQTPEASASPFDRLRATRGFRRKFCRQTTTRLARKRSRDGTSNCASRCYVISARWDAPPSWRKKSRRKHFFVCIPVFRMEHDSGPCAPGCFAWYGICGSISSVSRNDIGRRATTNADPSMWQPALPSPIRSNSSCSRSECGWWRVRFNACRSVSGPAWNGRLRGCDITRSQRNSAFRCRRRWIRFGGRWRSCERGWGSEWRDTTADGRCVSFRPSAGEQANRLFHQPSPALGAICWLKVVSELIAESFSLRRGGGGFRTCRRADPAANDSRSLFDD